jgi:hypothetical protein
MIKLVTANSPMLPKTSTTNMMGFKLRRRHDQNGARQQPDE